MRTKARVNKLALVIGLTLLIVFAFTIKTTYADSVDSAQVLETQEESQGSTGRTNGASDTTNDTANNTPSNEATDLTTNSPTDTATNAPTDATTDTSTDATTDTPTDTAAENSTDNSLDGTSEGTANGTASATENPTQSQANADPIKESTEPKQPVTPGVDRIYGDNRIATSIAVATELKQELGKDKFDSIIVTRSDKWQDALSGSYLASVEDAPILLVNSSDNTDVMNYIRNNLSTTGTIYVLGGNLAVSDKVESSLLSIGNVVRLHGATSYDTNLEILRTADRLTADRLAQGGTTSGDASVQPEGDAPKTWDTDLLVTTGKNFPDAITISALGKPIMLVYEIISNAQKMFLSEHLDDESTIYIIGGKAAVSEAAESQLAEYSTPVRIAGSNRYETSTAVADTFFKDSEEVALARGDIFPDAMVGGTIAHAKGIPLLLTENDTGFESAYKYIYKNKGIKRVTILGGPKALSEDTAAMTPDGIRRYGFLTIGNKLFCAQKSGDLYKNTFFTFEDGKEYAATTTGVIAKNGWGKVGKLNYYFKDFLVHSISRKAIAVLDEVGYTLRAAYNWSASMPYYSFDSNPNWGSIWFADYGFSKFRGNCYVMASTFYIMAKTLGYDVKQVAGYVNTTVHRAAHSWTFIKQDGDTWIYDPEFYNEHGLLAFKIKNGDTRWYYNSDWKVMPM